MGPVLSSLVKLQSIEFELRKTKKRHKKTQQMIKIQEQSITQHEAALAAKHEEIKLTRLQSHKLEMELQTREAEIQKLRLALNTAKTNKDYSMILTRINTDKADKAKLEDQILALMTQVEGDQQVCKDLEGQIEEEQGRLAEVREKAKAKQEAIEAHLQDIERQKEEALSEVPDKEGLLFQRLADRFDGEVLAEIREENSRRNDHTCGGCFMSITLESVNLLMTKDEVVTCPNCGRILVLDMQPAQEPSSS